MNLFLKDTLNSKSYTWESLIDDINSTSSYNPYCISADFYKIFKHIIFSLLLGEEIILLDSDFTESELIALTGHKDFNVFEKSVLIESEMSVIDKDDLISKCYLNQSNWSMTLFTSGTTGIPKKVCHNFQSISRFVKVSEKNKKNIWGFAYNPTHMAGIQVFFQALLNGNSIIRLFGLNKNDIYNDIKNSRITHISATPSFYRLLVSINHSFPTVERITSGGEKFNNSTFSQLQRTFPNAKITNVYASTEAGTIFASQNDIFCVRNEFLHLIRIENNELFIHKSLIAKTEFNIDEWYNTGDLIEIISESPLKFRFTNRKSEIINVGGYKVNPIEVEEAILSFENIQNVRVFAKANSVLGNIVCCEIVTNGCQITESEIRFLLQSKLQEFKIPRFFYFVEELSTTRTGKLKRN